MKPNWLWLVVLLLVAAASPASADYLQAVIANSTTGVATFNSTLSSGNSTWLLTHVPSGATPAGEAAKPFTNAVGLTVSYGGTYGNLTGNFTFRVTLNVSLGVVNNSTVWASETKEAGFAVSPPGPTPAPSPPPPAAGPLKVVLLSPDLNRGHKEVLKAEAIVTPPQGARITAVLASLQRGPPVACDSVPSGWQIAVLADEAKSIWTYAWSLNDSADPYPEGTYTLYVNATANDSSWSCKVAPGVLIRTAPQAEPSANQTGARANLTLAVEATACKASDRPCPQLLDGPPEKGDGFWFTLNAPAPVAVCGPTGCTRYGQAAKHQFKPDNDGRWCAKAIDPQTDAISHEIKCWTAGAGGYYGSTRRAPGLERDASADPRFIPCKPQVGFLSSTDEKGSEGVTTVVEKKWLLVPGYESYTRCFATEPVLWRVPHDGCLTGNFTTGKGVQQSRATDPDGFYTGPYLPMSDFKIWLPCPGTYTVQTMEKGDDPEKDSWATWAEFKVNHPGGPGPLEWAGIISFTVFSALLLAALALRTRHRSIMEWRREPGEWEPIERDFHIVTHNSKRLKGPRGDEPVLIAQSNWRASQRRRGTVERPVTVRFIASPQKYWNVRNETVNRVYARKVARSPLGSGFKEAHLPASDGGPMAKISKDPRVVLDGLILYAEDSERPALVADLFDYISASDLKSVTTEDAAKDAAAARMAEGSKAAKAEAEERVREFEDRLRGGAAPAEEKRGLI